MHIRQITFTSHNYPDMLRHISSPPKQLYAVGNTDLLTDSEQLRVAIVGSRKPSDYGKMIAYKLASELAAAGIVIISGLALGTDATAHKAAVDVGGRTIAVQACGMDSINPAANRNLAKDILRQKGCIISEYPAGTAAFKQNFIARNRIISGLSHATIITEAAEGSGSLFTANFALQQDRVVMAVPGNITSPRSSGPNNLIKSGAHIVTDANDVLNTLGYVQKTQPTAKADSKEELAIINLLKRGVNTSERLIEKSGLSASEFANIMSLMEITGKVRNLGAGNWISR